MPPIPVAPFSVAISTIRSTWSGESLMPGMSGAIRIPVGIPARLSSPTASSRARGCGVCGSVARHAFSSSVGTDRFAVIGIPRSRISFTRESSDLFDRPSINLARIIGGDAFNKVPDECTIDVDIRFLPGQDPGELLAQIRGVTDLSVVKVFTRVPAQVSRRDPYVLALREAVGRTLEDEALSIGRDGASDAVSFQEAGIPAVEFGPVGAGHHGPEEWVSLSSLTQYRRAL